MYIDITIDLYEGIPKVNNLYRDCHAHIEGMFSQELPDFFEQSVRIASKNSVINRELDRIIQRPLKILKRDFQELASGKASKRTWTFEEFLTKLYITKLILSTDYHIAQEFITSALQEYFAAYDHIRFSITPSLPYDFPHIEAEQWYQAVYTGLKNALTEGKSLHLVIETKRQHLNRLAEKDQWVYQGNLDFLRYLIEMNHPQITYSLGICDNENAFPLFEPERMAHLVDYLKASKLNREIGITLHTLESHKSRSISPFQQTRELRLLLQLFKTLRIKQANYIHLGNVFSAATPKRSKRTHWDQQAVQHGLRLLRKLSKRQDRIITCFTSNLRLGNPTLLAYPEVLTMILEGELNVIPATDDPWVFGVKDIAQEIDSIAHFLEKKKRAFPTSEILERLIQNMYFE